MYYRRLERVYWATLGRRSGYLTPSRRALSPYTQGGPFGPTRTPVAKGVEDFVKDRLLCGRCTINAQTPGTEVLWGTCDVVQ